MSPNDLFHYLIIGAVLFTTGMLGFLTRRNLIIMFLCAELMLQGVVINLLAFSRVRGNLQGQVFALFILTVAACEAAIALALILMLYRRRKSLDVSLWQNLREPDQEAVSDDDRLPAVPREDPLPVLPQAGPAPTRQEKEPSHV